MSNDNDTATPAPIKTYFWMVHYDFSPVAQAEADDGLVPIPAGRKRGIMVISRNLYGNQILGFKMPRETEGDDPVNFRGPAVLRNRIIGFYASAEEANAHMTDKLWNELRQKAGAIYAELHTLKVDVAEAKPELLKLVA
jgi:hypothetical protein